MTTKENKQIEILVNGNIDKINIETLFEKVGLLYGQKYFLFVEDDKYCLFQMGEYIDCEEEINNGILVEFFDLIPVIFNDNRFIKYYETIDKYFQDGCFEHYKDSGGDEINFTSLFVDVK